MQEVFHEDEESIQAGDPPFQIISDNLQSKSEARIEDQI